MQQTSDTTPAAEVVLPEAKDPRPPARILIADDARCAQKTLSALLTLMNIQVDIAEDGVAACELAEQSNNDGRPYDLILMDLQMPKMNGQKATRWLRQHGWQGPIVAVSAYASEDERAHLQKAGCTDCVLKPATASKLRDVFLKYLWPKSN
jgi:CheY-like chemotaxis protein